MHLIYFNYNFIVHHNPSSNQFIYGNMQNEYTKGLNIKIGMSAMLIHFLPCFLFEFILDFKIPFRL